MWSKFLASPYILAFLVAVYPVLFFIANNWFMFEPSHALFLFLIFSPIIFMALSFYHLALFWFVRKLCSKSPEKITQRLFVLAVILVWAYLLRNTFLEVLGRNLLLFLTFAMVLASSLAWFTPKIQIFRLNIVLGVMCLFQLGAGLESILTAKTNSSFDANENKLSQPVYSQVKFSKSPNVYYIVPDGYPNREALEEIFHLDKGKFYEGLESLGFTIYPSAFSNYMYTLASVSSLLGMDQHYYRGSIGNFEMLDSRKFIVSDQNPVVRIFKNNGYQVSYVHETDYLLRNGCFIDLCSPSISWWGDFFDILVPPRLSSIPVLAGVIEPIYALRKIKDKEQTLAEFMPRVLRHIDFISTQSTPHFTYIHARLSGHSSTGKQTLEELSSFRETYFKRIQIATNTVETLVQRILERDSDALIIVNADHGAWGYGNYIYAENEVLEGASDDLSALDHLGVLLAIRWPDNASKFVQDIRTNVNLFRYIFAYLSGSNDILTTKVPDDGYLIKGKGKDGILLKVINEGKILDQMLDMGPVK